MKKSAWLLILAFGILVYTASTALTSMVGAAHVWAVSIFPSLCALAAFFEWQRWKGRARKCEQELRTWKDALFSVGFETANAVNAIRSNLLGFRQVNPAAAMPEHLAEIDQGTERIAAALKIAEDPVAWQLQRQAREASEVSKP